MDIAKQQVPTSNSFWRTRSGIALLVFGAIAAFFLLAEHRAHVLGALPYILLLMCPLMHVFHSGHGGDRHHHDDAATKREGKQP